MMDTRFDFSKASKVRESLKAELMRKMSEKQVLADDDLDMVIAAGNAKGAGVRKDDAEDTLRRSF